MSLLRLYETAVPAAWVDYNGHMNDAAYAKAFSYATDALMAYIGLNPDTRADADSTIYTLENHICYLLEAKQGEALYVTTQLLQHDAKRLRVFHALYRDGEDAPLATSEQMLLHVAKAGPKAAPFADDVAEHVRALAQAQAGLPMPEWVGRAIRTL